MTRSVTRSLCDSWASCSLLLRRRQGGSRNKQNKNEIKPSTGWLDRSDSQGENKNEIDTNPVFLAVWLVWRLWSAGLTRFIGLNRIIIIIITIFIPIVARDYKLKHTFENLDSSMHPSNKTWFQFQFLLYIRCGRKSNGWPLPTWKSDPLKFWNAPCLCLPSRRPTADVDVKYNACRARTVDGLMLRTSGISLGSNIYPSPLSPSCCEVEKKLSCRSSRGRAMRKCVCRWNLEL